MTTSSPPQHRFLYIDTLRALAALAVLFNHFVYTFGLPKELIPLQRFTPINLAWDGFGAVGFFFVLSGFVLSFKYLARRKEQPKQRINLISFYIARIFRIYPAFLVVLLVSAAANAFMLRHLHDPWFLGPTNQFWGGPHNLADTLRQGLLLCPSLTTRYVIQDWTLKWEIVFSLLIPFLILIAERNTWWLIVFSGVSLLCFQTNKFLFHFTLGVVLASAFLWLSPRLRKLSPAAKITLGILSLYLYAFRFTPPFDILSLPRADLVWYIKAVGATGILFCAFSSPTLQKLLELGPGKLFGKTSYSLYLVHYAILICLGPVYMHWIGQGKTEFSSAQLWLGLSISVVLSLLASLPLYCFVELPGIRLGKFFGAYFQRHRAAETPKPVISPASETPPLRKATG